MTPYAVSSSRFGTQLFRLLSQPSLSAHCRYASILGALRDVPESYSKRIRRGRGPSSGKGKTSGRGHKGQGQHGKVPAGFTGGQTPVEVVHGKRGFKNVFSVEMSPLNLDKLQEWIDKGRINPLKPITFKELLDSRCVHGIKDGVKLLAKGRENFKTPIHIIVSRASAAAITAVEAAGGSVTTRYFNSKGIDAIIHRDQFEEEPRLAGAFSRFDIEYYRDPAHRGYLAESVPAGASPSLLFRTPFEKASRSPSASRKPRTRGDDKKAANQLFKLSAG